MDYTLTSVLYAVLRGEVDYTLTSVLIDCTKGEGGGAYSGGPFAPLQSVFALSV